MSRGGQGIIVLGDGPMERGRTQERSVLTKGARLTSCQCCLELGGEEKAAKVLPGRTDGADSRRAAGIQVEGAPDAWAQGEGAGRWLLGMGAAPVCRSHASLCSALREFALEVLIPVSDWSQPQTLAESAPHTDSRSWVPGG